MNAITEQWEYETIYNPSDEELNAMGIEGWQLVSVVPTSNNGHWAYMMRPKKTMILPRVTAPMPYPWAQVRAKAIKAIEESKL
ncbi:MAG: hypothetical protein AAGA46_00450 [Cyanobacteria bacterium P01_F01_bin.13]